jgi:hypothetical protein
MRLKKFLLRILGQTPETPLQGVAAFNEAGEGATNTGPGAEGVERRE